MREEMIICSKCGDPTSKPPDEMIEWLGLCPDCVVETHIFPLISEKLQKLLKVMMSQRGGPEGIALVIGGGGGENFADAFKRGLLTDPQVRKGLQEILDLLEKDVPIQKHVVKKPVTHNDPRWS